MLEANESLENIFTNSVNEAEKRKHEYVTIEHILLSLVKDKDVGQILHDFKINVSEIIKDVEDYLDTKCTDIISKSSKVIKIGKEAFYKQLEMPLYEAYKYTSEIMSKNMMTLDAKEGISAFIAKRTPNWKNK